LVTARKINPDQKAQILKKPSLQASLAQLEEQIAQYKKFDQEYKAQSQAEKAEFEKTITERMSKELEEKTKALEEKTRELEKRIAEEKANAVALALKDQQNALLLLSQFLRLAAIRRGDEDADAELDENKALEGVLSKVYEGNQEAVDHMIDLIQGSEKTTFSIHGEALTTTC
jgi:hypothetical protein